MRDLIRAVLLMASGLAVVRYVGPGVWALGCLGLVLGMVALAGASDADDVATAKHVLADVPPPNRLMPVFDLIGWPLVVVTFPIGVAIAKRRFRFAGMWTAMAMDARRRRGEG